MKMLPMPVITLQLECALISEIMDLHCILCVSPLSVSTEHKDFRNRGESRVSTQSHSKNKKLQKSMSPKGDFSLFLGIVMRGGGVLRSVYKMVLPCAMWNSSPFALFLAWPSLIKIDDFFFVVLIPFVPDRNY